jgi:hypothetical protein
MYVCTMIFTTRESGICPWSDFSFVPGIFPSTNEGICTGWGGPEDRPPTRPVHPHLYWVGASPGTNVPTFVPGLAYTTFILGQDTTRYKIVSVIPYPVRLSYLSRRESSPAVKCPQVLHRSILISFFVPF